VCYKSCVRLAVIVGMLGILVAGCGTARPDDAGASLTPPTEPASVLECGALPLQAPDGRPIFLSGTWMGTGDPNAAPRPSVYYLRQTNDCLVWVGLSAEAGEALGASWIETFHGTIGSNFEIDGRWDEVLGEPNVLRGDELGSGLITLKIEPVPVGDGYDVELVLLDADGDLHYTQRWVREGTIP
jgi:hypothetical protein